MGNSDDNCLLPQNEQLENEILHTLTAHATNIIGYRVLPSHLTLTRPSTMGELTIESPPIDGVSAVHFSPQDSNHLLVSSWDSVSYALLLYDICSLRFLMI